jgi:hypothetical protein
MTAVKKASRLVWSTGELYSQSSRFPCEPNKKEEENEENEEKKPMQNDTKNNKTEMEKVNDFLHPTADLVRNKQREQFDFQIADREMFPQCGTNPFFTDSSYVDQISTQMDMRQKN